MTLAAAAALAVALLVAPANGRQAPADPPVSEGPPPPPPAGETATADDPPLSLDELLGLDEDEQAASAEDVAAREAEAELERRLNEAEVRDAFRQALEKMTMSAELLDVRFDTGLATQRVQEDILAKLDQLIEFAKQQQQQQQSSSSSSSSSSQQQQQQQQQQPNQQTQRSQQQQQDASGARSREAADSQEGEAPPRQDGDVNQILDETRTEWGNLPPRLRRELLQGRDDRYSSLYKRLTEEYYRRLAEDGRP